MSPVSYIRQRDVIKVRFHAGQEIYVLVCYRCLICDIFKDLDPRNDACSRFLDMRKLEAPKIYAKFIDRFIRFD